MPIKISNNLPAYTVLNNEKIFVMTDSQAQKRKYILYDGRQSNNTGYTSAQNCYIKSYAQKNRNGNTDTSSAVKYTASGGY